MRLLYHFEDTQWWCFRHIIARGLQQSREGLDARILFSKHPAQQCGQSGPAVGCSPTRHPIHLLILLLMISALLPFPDEISLFVPKQSTHRHLPQQFNLGKFVSNVITMDSNGSFLSDFALLHMGMKAKLIHLYSIDQMVSWKLPLTG